MLSWLHSKMHTQCAITYAALTLVVIALIVLAMCVPIPSAATEQKLPSTQPSPKLTKKKPNPSPATDETIKVSSTLKIYIHPLNLQRTCMHMASVKLAKTYMQFHSQFFNVAIWEWAWGRG